MNTDPYGVTTVAPGLAPMRMLRGLWRMGWPSDVLAKRYGIPMRVLDEVLEGREHLSEVTANQVTAMWVELASIPGPSWRAIAQAIKLGWPAAHEWTEDAVGAPDHPLLQQYPKADAASPGAQRLRSRIAVRSDRRRGQ